MKIAPTKTWLLTVLLAATMLLFGFVPTQAAGSQKLRSEVPSEVSRLSPLGPLDRTQHLSLAIGLPLRNQANLNDLLRQLSDPSSPNYRHYLTPSQFTEEFGPTEKDYKALIGFAKAQGLNVTGTHPNRLILDAEGPVPVVEKTFHVTMMSYQHPTETRKFFAPNTAPSIDLDVAILGVSGLNNYSLPKPRYKPVQDSGKPDAAGRSSATPGRNASAASASPNVGSGPNTGYMGTDFRTAYAPGVTLTGSGQTVGLLQFDGYTASDITYYETKAGLPAVPLTNVLLDGFSGTPTGNGGEVEVSLDIETSMSMAPGLSGIIVYEAGPSGNWHDILNRMANDNLAKQLSCSWYIPSGVMDAVADQIFQQMQAQGQSFFSASGDYDAFTGLIPFPGDTPYVTEVGGTLLNTASAGGAYSSETAWNRNNGIGSGGGISTQYAIPTWQQGIGMTGNLGSTTMRNVPDVALTADYVYVHADGSDVLEGGTSCAAPLWAGFTALINQRSMSNSNTTVGFMNPLVYAIGKGANYASALHDTTVGNNYSTSSPAKFPATTGYDLCTGWGSPKGEGLIDAIAGPAVPIISTTSPLLSGTAATPYTATITATGGSPAYSFSILAGVLPSSFNLSSSGVLSGTTAATGIFNFTVQVTDSKNASSSQPFSLTIYPTGTPIITTTSPLSLGIPNAFYNQALAATGGMTPYSWTLASGNLPAGLNLGTTGVISGTPTGAGAASFTVQVKDNNGLASTMPFSLTIATPPTISTGGTLASGLVKAAYSQSLVASGGKTPYNFSLASGALPPGLNLSSGGLISGTPTSGGTANFSVRVTGGDGAYSAMAFTLTIAPFGALSHFAWSTIGTAQTINSPFPATITAQDALNNTVTTFSSTANLAAHQVSGSSSIVISEIDNGDNDAIEFLNVSGAAKDISGWQFIAYDWNSWPGPSVTFTIPQGTVVAANQVFLIRENGTAPGTFPTFYTGSNIYWNSETTGNPLGALLLDAGGNIVDFVCAFDAVPSQITQPVSIPSSQWTSAPLAANTDTTNTYTYQRIGASDNNSSADWHIVAATLGTLNTGLTTPFLGPTTIPITPTVTGAFSSGTWSGSITATQPATGVILTADDGAGHTGSSNAFAVTTSADLTVNPATGLSSSGSIGGPFNPSSAAYTVTNTGTGSMTWTASATMPWITLSSTGGTLSSGASTTVTASINATANTLAASAYSDTVTFANTTSGYGNTTRPVALNVTQPAPVITSGSTATAFVGQAFSYQITATNSPISYNATGLPAGLSVNTATGLISGTPTVTGTFNATISAANVGGSGLGSLRIAVPPSIPVMNPLPPFGIGTSNTVSWSAVPGATLYDVQASADGTFNTVIDSGWVAGTSYTFTGLSVGSTYSYRVRASIGSGPDGSWNQPASTGFNFDSLTNTSLVSGAIYIADSGNDTIRKVTLGGVVTTFAGSAGVSGGTDGAGSSARFNYPSGGVVDPYGNYYETDLDNNTVRKITPGGTVTTIAGLAGTSGTTDGTGSAARFNGPFGVVMDSSGNLYVSDRLNQTIRKIAPGGIVTTFAGTAGSVGSTDGTGSAARFNGPAELAIDSSGNLYVPDQSNSTIRKITPGAVVTTLAGSAGVFASKDGTGSAASFNNPSSIAVDGLGNLYVTDNGNATIRKVTQGGVVTTLAGLAGNTGSADGTGSAARFDRPHGITVDDSGNIFETDNFNFTVRKITPLGVVTTIAGSPLVAGSADGTGSSARFNYPAGAAADHGAGVTLASSSGVYGSSGTVVSTIIAPSPFEAWGPLTYSDDVSGSGTTLTVDVLSSTGTVLAANISSGTDLSTVPAIAGVSAIELRANLATSNPANTPKLSSWSVGYYSSSYSWWSGQVTSTQAQPPAFANPPPIGPLQINVAYGFNFSAIGFPFPVNFTLDSGALPPGLDLTQDGTLSGTPSQAGIYTGAVRASNGVPPDATQAFNLTVLNTFSIYESGFFTALQMQQADPDIIGPNANPGNDGTSNLLKYLFDINPAVAMTTSDRAALPQVALTPVGGITYLTLTYRMNPLAGGITVNVQTSSDLISWNTVTPDLSRSVGTDGVTGDPMEQVGIKTNGSAMEFIRLNVTSP